MLAPSVESEGTFVQRIESREPAARGSIRSTDPSSSIIPVNICFHCELVFGNHVHLEIVKNDSVRAPLAPRAAELLEISHRALLYKIKEYGVDPEAEGRGSAG